MTESEQNCGKAFAQKIGGSISTISREWNKPGASNLQAAFSSAG
jgi:hypothetical protein